MKDFTFYLEHNSPQDKRKGKNTGNVLAAEGKAYINRATGKAVVNALSAVTIGTPNTVMLNWGEVSPEYLRQNCTRIGEKKAREHHPNLFVRLENDIKNYS